LGHLLLVDLGGSSLKIGLCRLDGEIVSLIHNAREFIEEGGGASEQDPEIWWQSLIKGIEDLLAVASNAFFRIVAVVICGITRSQVFRDKRAALQVEKVQAKLEQFSAQAGNRFTQQNCVRIINKSKSTMQKMHPLP